MKAGRNNFETLFLRNIFERAKRHPTNYTYILIVGIQYQYKHELTYNPPYPGPEGPKDTQEITHISQLLAWYIQYQCKHELTYNPPTLGPKGPKTPNKLHISPNCWHDIYNTNVNTTTYTHTPNCWHDIYNIFFIIHGVKLSISTLMVSNWSRCQIGPGVKLSLLHSWCQIGPGVKLTLLCSWCQIDSFTLLVSNWLRCQIDSFVLLVSNWSGVKLTPVSNWLRCQIGAGVKLSSNRFSFSFFAQKLSPPVCQSEIGKQVFILMLLLCLKTPVSNLNLTSLPDITFAYLISVRIRDFLWFRISNSLLFVF